MKKLESLNQSKFTTLSKENLAAVNGGGQTGAGRETVGTEALYNQNNEFTGWRTHYRGWSSDSNDGTQWSYFNVSYYYEDQMVE